VRARFNAAFADIAAVTTLNQRNALARIEDIDGQIRSLLVSLSLGFLLALLVALTAGTMLLRVIQARCAS
jgi:methyl-accepting chemotaxis protein WspA